MGPSEMDNSTAFSALGAFVFMIFLVVALTGNVNLNDIQNSSLKARLSFASHINVSICCLSMAFHLMHVLGGLLRADHGMLNKMSFFEYVMTCPWMMLVFVLLGGPKVQGDKYRTVVMSTTVLVLLFGFIASLVNNILLKTTCFLFGVSLFCIIIYIINRAVLEHSQGEESLFSIGKSAHASWYKALAKKIFMTWVLFPIWWLMSPEGFAFATDSHDVDSMVKLFLNCFAKGLYVVYIRSLQSRFNDETETCSFPTSHPAEKDRNATRENLGKHLDEHGEKSSSTLDIESGHAHAVLPVVDDHPASSDESANADEHFITAASTKSLSTITGFSRLSSKETASTRSSSKETTSTRSSSKESVGRPIEEIQTSTSLASSMPSERQLEREERPPPSNTDVRQLEGGESESTSAEVIDAMEVKLLWQEIQSIKNRITS
eukprot:gnl/MRDRNA2_/MRDRNA2_27413_c0_seq1.p1 gnl/MRDRNA2_/MRDRNA2_27413_c0~~gnl/MRDRNA2_/MRDRNA2_27413_c0_seq1.p1  ORF type:complete len:467 (-),score=62.58 gnl/MRDRNA2_/MRDRNA2_27413_c0_seq1:497-1798(-)